MREIKYKVTGFFGIKKIGEIINAHLIVEDSDNGNALILHKPNKSESGCFEICRQDNEGYYISSNQDIFVNFEKMSEIKL